MIVKRELSATGKNRIFVNNQLVTQSFLKKIGGFLVDIHGQGDTVMLNDTAAHLSLLDNYAGVSELRQKVAAAHARMNEVRRELDSLREDEAQKLQLVDILQFQVDEIGKAALRVGEDDALEEEKKRLSNVEKLSTLSDDAYNLLYDDETATITTLEKVIRRVADLGEFDARFRDYNESLENARAVLDDLAFAVRDFRNSLEFSPERLDEIEDRLAEISRLRRKYGGSIESVLSHFEDSTARLRNIESAELRESELRRELAVATESYLVVARELHEKRNKAATSLAKKIEAGLRDVSLEKARFEVRVDGSETDVATFTARGFDRVGFFFSANPGESLRPLAKVASGGELSRLMLVLSTTAKFTESPATMVFDEIDTGIGGRVAEAVGLKLKQLAATVQVLCVTHQPQVAALADHHFVVRKVAGRARTEVGVAEIAPDDRVEEIARMLAGEKITDTARQHARELLGGAHGQTA